MSSSQLNVEYEYKLININEMLSMNAGALASSQLPDLSLDEYAISNILFEPFSKDLETKLNELGAEGWELVTATDSFYTMKRAVK